ncbi:MAG: PaaI family thioesterase [Sphingomonadaceae bacterium]|nr:PaaI family thioesterase [Sphingomonadaceae bacterium]
MTETEVEVLEMELPAYARSLGLAFERIEQGAPVLVMPFAGHVEGRPTVLHGGATSGLLENAGYAALRAELHRQGRHVRLKPIGITVQFLTAAKCQATYAMGHVNRLGRRNANIEVVAWQESRDKPVASAVMNILMVEDEG